MLDLVSIDAHFIKCSYTKIKNKKQLQDNNIWRHIIPTYAFCMLFTIYKLYTERFTNRAHLVFSFNVFFFKFWTLKFLSILEYIILSDSILTLNNIFQNLNIQKNLERCLLNIFLYLNLVMVISLNYSKF